MLSHNAFMRVARQAEATVVFVHSLPIQGIEMGPGTTR